MGPLSRIRPWGDARARPGCRRARVLELAGPAARAVAGCPQGRIAAVYRSTLSVRCGGLLVNLSDAPVLLACSARVSGATLAALARLPIGSPVRLDADGAAVRSMRLTATGLRPGALPQAALGSGSWFDSPAGRQFGRPRLRAAAGALATDSGADALVALCGLGIGLTPSGDDALVGMLALARRAGRATGTCEEFAERLDEGMSTEVSLDFLRLALGGEFSIPVLRLMDALGARVSPTAQSDRPAPAAQVDSPPPTTQIDRPALAVAVREVARIGHSSGADLLAGVAALGEFLADQEETA